MSSRFKRTAVIGALKSLIEERRLVTKENRVCPGGGRCGNPECRGGHRMGNRYYLQLDHGEQFIAAAIMEGRVLPSGRHKSKEKYLAAAKKVLDHRAGETPGQALSPGNGHRTDGAPEPVENLSPANGLRTKTPGQTLSPGGGLRGSYVRETNDQSPGDGLPVRDLTERAPVSNFQTNFQSSSSSLAGEFRAQPHEPISDDDDDQIPGPDALQPVAASGPGSSPAGPTGPSTATGFSDREPAADSSEAGRSERLGSGGPGQGPGAGPSTDLGADQVRTSPAGSGPSGHVRSGGADQGQAVGSGGPDPEQHRGVSLSRLVREVQPVLGSVDPSEVRLIVDEVLDRASGSVSAPGAYVRRAVGSDIGRWQRWLTERRTGLSSAVGSVSGAGFGKPRSGPCPIPDHANSGYLEVNCPACRKFHDFPVQIERSVFDRLDEGIQTAVIRSGVSITSDDQEQRRAG